MAYRVYRFGGGGNIESVEVIEAQTDAEAVIVARAMDGTATREIWDRDRLVARLSAIRLQA